MNIDGLVEDFGDLPGPEESLDFELYEALRLLHELDRRAPDQIALPGTLAGQGTPIYSDPMV
jgi:hypothetical protein